MNLYEIYFSPTGGTKKVADIMIKAMKKDAQEIDMIKDPDKILQTEFSEDDICLIAVPSYGGRIPSVTVDKFQKLRNKAITLYSNGVDECFIGIISILNEIRNAAQELSDDNSLEDKTYSKSLRKILCQHENDDISIKLSNIIKEVETNLKPIYAPKTIIWKHFNKETNND